MVRARTIPLLSMTRTAVDMKARSNLFVATLKEGRGLTAPSLLILNSFEIHCLLQSSSYKRRQGSGFQDAAFELVIAPEEGE